MYRGEDALEYLRRRAGGEAAAQTLALLVQHVDQLTPPSLSDSAAVALKNPKTAALAFDRVWGGLDSTMPTSTGFWVGTTIHEPAFLATVATQLTRDKSGFNVDLAPF